MSQTRIAVARPRESVLATNKLIRNTYLLLSMTLIFSALAAVLAVVTGFPPLAWVMAHPGFYLVIELAGFLGLLHMTHLNRNRAAGIGWAFAFTGFMGLTLGPMLTLYLQMANGPQLIAMAMGGTGVIFLGLSAYALTTRKDFSFLAGFVMVGILVSFLAGIGAWIFRLPALSLAVSAMFVLLMSAFILWRTSEMVHGYETNYIVATVSLYVSIYNLFLSLLHLLGAFGGED